MINNEIKTVLLAAMLPCLAPAAIYTNAWDVDLPRNPPAVIDLWRGETVALCARTAAAEAVKAAQPSGGCGGRAGEEKTAK